MSPPPLAVRNRPLTLGVIAALAWLIQKNMNEAADPAMRVLLGTLAVIFLTLTGDGLLKRELTHQRTIVAGVVGLICFFAAFYWPSIQRLFGAEFTASAVAFASNFYVWMGLVFLVLVYGMVMSVISNYQRYNMADVIRNDMVPFRRALEKWVVPRTLTSAQTETIGEVLRKYDPRTVTIVVKKNDDEAIDYSGRFRSALAKGGWTISGIEYADEMRPGLSTSTSESDQARREREQHRRKTSHELLQEAFSAVNIRFEGSQTGGSGEHFRLMIGARRRDMHASMQVIPP